MEASRSGPAPEGYYLTGVNVLPQWRRGGVAEALTRARLAWIGDHPDRPDHPESDVRAWYFASVANLASIALHERFGCIEVLRAQEIQGVGFTAGEGILFRLTEVTGVLPEPPGRRTA